MSIEAIVNEFSAVAANPKGQLKAYKDAGKKCIGVMPYYAPEELVYAAGMMPFGMWGSNDKTEQRSKEYCATFYCTIAQLDLEMLLDGTMDLLDGVITPTICDTLRPMSQNIRVAMSEKLPCIFLAHPQNRFADWGKQFCLDQYNNVKAGLEKIAGHEIKSEDIAAAIKVYNKSRAARREFVKLASDHCDVIDPIMRSAVLKAAWFMDKAEYTEKLEALNAEIAALPEAKWNGVKVVTSGIICDNPTLLKIFKDNNVAIAADDVARRAVHQHRLRRAALRSAVQQEPPRRVRGQHGQGVRRTGPRALHAAVLRSRGDGVPVPQEGARRRWDPLHQARHRPADARLRPGGDRHPGVCRRALRAVRKVSFPSCRARQEGKAVKNAQKVHTRLQIEQPLCYNPN